MKFFRSPKKKVLHYRLNSLFSDMPSENKPLTYKPWHGGSGGAGGCEHAWQMLALLPPQRAQRPRPQTHLLSLSLSRRHFCLKNKVFLVHLLREIDG